MLLCDLKVGEKSSIININLPVREQIRLYDLGLINGTNIQTILEHKSIKAYLFRNTLVAIRNKDAKNIIVEDIYD